MSRKFYRNTGALHRRPASGRVLREGTWTTDAHARKGDVFEPTAEEVARQAYKLEEVNPATLPPDPEQPGVVGPSGETPPAEEDEAAAEENPPAEVEEPSPGISGDAEPAALPREEQPEPAPKRKEPARRVSRPKTAGGGAESDEPAEGEEDLPPLDDVDSYYVGGGWYTLPGGERVRGKDAAGERLTEILSEEG